MSENILVAIDQGTTSSRAIAFKPSGEIIATAQQEFPQIFQHPGWVEHDPEAIWQTVLETTREVMERVGVKNVAAIGITNQRETSVLWDRDTHEVLGNAIVWQDRRTASICADLLAAGVEETVTARSGLRLDPYFSATKAAWMLDTYPDGRAKAEAGKVAFGTIDSFLLWRLTGGKSHKTDATNAARTNLYNIHSGMWDETLLRIFKVPANILPEVTDCAHHFGETDPKLLGRAIPIMGMAGDQQAAAVGQTCFTPGAVKSTYGTGTFLIINTGDMALQSQHKLLTTVCYQLNGQATYALEGSIFVAGAAVQWLRDGLGLIKSAVETQALASSLPDNGGVYLVPAFVGLGAPYWDPDARGAIYGLSRDTGPAHFARAALESVGYQTADLMQAMEADGITPAALRVDGGMVANPWMCQFLADILDTAVDRPRVTETTALGAAYLAGLGAGIYSDLEDIANQWQLEKRFEPAMAADQRTSLLAGWGNAIARTRTSG